MIERNLNSINALVVHCADTYPNMDVGVKEIREWHKSRGWDDIGYHYVIRRDGLIEHGRPLFFIGAHVAGYNTNSIGICMVGGKGINKNPENNFTDLQFASLLDLVKELKLIFLKANVLGHRDLPGVQKSCPCFDVKTWFQENHIR